MERAEGKVAPALSLWAITLRKFGIGMVRSRLKIRENNIWRDLYTPHTHVRDPALCSLLDIMRQCVSEGSEFGMAMGLRALRERSTGREAVTSS